METSWPEGIDVLSRRSFPILKKHLCVFNAPRMSRDEYYLRQLTREFVRKSRIYEEGYAVLLGLLRNYIKSDRDIELDQYGYEDFVLAEYIPEVDGNEEVNDKVKKVPPPTNPPTIIVKTDQDYLDFTTSPSESVSNEVRISRWLSVFLLVPMIMFI